MFFSVKSFQQPPPQETHNVPALHCGQLWLDALDLLCSDVTIKIMGGYARSGWWMTCP